MKISQPLIVILALILHSNVRAQKEASQWHFGNKMALSFLTSPPSVVSSSIQTAEGCASIADTSGNLLFYTNGMEVWNSSHAIMANGSGLFGSLSTTQGAFAFKLPENDSLYYLFTIADEGLPDGFRYHIINMNLAAGLGSVTVKNVPIHSPSSEHMAVTRHCNGRDVWILTHDYNSADFRAVLLTPMGLSSQPVVSTTGPVISGMVPNPTDLESQGYMKFSPDGRRIVFCNIGLSRMYLGDFNSSTGVVSSVNLLDSTSTPIGCEFSQDGSKLYISCYAPQATSGIFQWDMCAGTHTAIMASRTLVAITPGPFTFAGMQIGIDGKIYVLYPAQNNIGVINFPDLQGTACTYSNGVYTVTMPKITGAALPFYLSNTFIRKPAPFTFSLNCQTAQFNGSSVVSSMTPACSAASYSLSSVTWNFGDPASGPDNTANGNDASHQFSSTGTFTPMMILNYPCRSDTIRVPVNITQAAPDFSVTGTTTICAGQKITLQAHGAYAFYWSSGSSSPSISITPPGNTTITVTATQSNGCQNSKRISITVNNCAGLYETQNGDGLRVWPNPAEDRIMIQSAGADTFFIRDITGRTLLCGSLAPGLNTLDVSGLAPGIYLLDSGAEKRMKIVKAGG